MSKVVSLKGAVLSEKKAAWLDQVAQAYDAFRAAAGLEPDGLIMVMIGGDKIKSAWDLPVPADDQPWQPAGVLMIASEHLRRQAYMDDLDT